MDELTWIYFTERFNVYAHQLTSLSSSVTISLTHTKTEKSSVCKKEKHEQCLHVQRWLIGRRQCTFKRLKD